MTAAFVSMIMPVQVERPDLTAAVSAYSQLTQPLARPHRSEYEPRLAGLAALTHSLQLDAEILSSNGPFREDQLAAFLANFLQQQRDVAWAVHELNYPCGVVNSYGIQMALIDAMAELELFKKSPQRALHIKAQREFLRMHFVRVFQGLL